MFSISVHRVLLFLISIGLYKSKYLVCLYQLRSDDTDIFPYKTDSAASVVVYPISLFNGKRCLAQGWEWIEPLCNYLLCRGLVRIIVQQKNEKLYLVIYSQKNDLRSVVLLRWVKVPYCKRLEILASYSNEFFFVYLASITRLSINLQSMNEKLIRKIKKLSMELTNYIRCIDKD